MTVRTGIFGAIALAVIALGAWRFFGTAPGFGEDGLTAVAWTCGNGVCDAAFGEGEDACVRDCAGSARPVGFYAEVSNCDPAARIVHPETAAEVQDAVRSAVAAGLRVKATGTGHSIAGNFCSDGIVIAFDRMTRVGEVERWNDLDTVVVEPGARFEALGERLHAAGRSFGPRSTGWGQIGVLGSVLTGSHGTSTREPSSIHEMLVALTVVDATGALVEYDRFTTEPELWRALEVSDGALGVVVAARLEVVPDRRMALTIRSSPLADVVSAEALARIFAECDYSFLMLFPLRDRAAHACAVPTDAPVTHERLTNYLFSPAVSAPRRALSPGMFQLAAVWSPAEWMLERVSHGYFTGASVGIAPEDPAGEARYVGLDGVGWNHRIVNMPRFAYSLPYFSQVDYEVAVRVADLPEVLADIHVIFDRAGRTLPVTGVIVRFDRATSRSLLGGNAVRPGVAEGEALAHIELPTYQPYGFGPEALAAYRAPSVAVVEHVFARYPTARPHLGKNDAATLRAFTATGNGASQVARFQAAVDTLDPTGVFANAHLRDLGVSWPREGERAVVDASAR